MSGGDRRDRGGGGAAAAATLVHESDWLGTRPFFYNERTGAASHDIHAVIDLADLEFDPEGFNDYLDFGFSVFGRTPVRDVRLLPPCARLWRGADGRLRVERLADPAAEWYDRRSDVDEVVDLARERVAAALDAAGTVVLPTSGGFDSRFLHLLVPAEERGRLRAFTYGTTDQPQCSSEAVKAREVARRLGVPWELVPLGDFHRHLAAWERLYGVATHAHGMYHFEFYGRVLARLAGTPALVLSGACGEWFAGDDPEVRVIPVLRTAEDVLTVFRYAGMNADSRFSLLRSERRGAEELLAQEPRLREEVLPRVVTVVRLRMVLLSFLLRVPEALGLRVRAPFLEPDLALRMLTLPPELRLGRRWQRDLFRRAGLDLESERLPADDRNTLNLRAMRRWPLPPLDEGLLREVVRPEYVRWVNRTVGPWGLPWELLWRLGWTPGFRRGAAALRRAGLSDRRLPAYAAYLTLWPVQELLRRRERARRGGEG